MNNTFFFYDLETSGLSGRYDRVMQFAGQRADTDLNPVGEPYNLLIKLTDDILPSPEALLITKITPQQTQAEGISEYDFCKILTDEIFTPGTITLGYNSIRFDDEFIRHTLWRNFYDPYEWAYADGRSRWDLLDVVRLVRALRPKGIKWPTDAYGKATNRLELLTKWNKLDHVNAHDALSDVIGLIEVTKLLRSKQPKMFDYLLTLRDKKELARLVNLENPVPFVYASGRFDSKFEKTTVCAPIAPGKNPGSVLLFDIRHNPDDFADWTDEQIKSAVNASWAERSKSDFVALPVKEMAYNRCPAVAPLGVLDDDSQKRLDLSLAKIEQHFAALVKNQGLVDRIVAAWNDRPDYAPASDVEGQLYDSFTPDSDKPRIRAVRACSAEELADFHPNFIDERLPELLFRYKARQFPQSLSEAEYERWELWRSEKLHREIPGYMQRLAQIASTNQAAEAQFVLEECQLWAESIVPISD